MSRTHAAAGRLRIMAKGAAAEIRLEDGSTGELFALCPFTPANQAVVIEATVDSSRSAAGQQDMHCLLPA